MPSKDSDPLQFTEKPLKGLKNTSSKGDLFEKKASEYFHKNYQAILVSSKVLRSIQCGQVDVAVIKENQLNIIELKSGNSKINTKQYNRLYKSLEFLIHIFDLEGRVLVLKDLPKD